MSEAKRDCFGKYYYLGEKMTCRQIVKQELLFYLLIVVVEHQGQEGNRDQDSKLKERMEWNKLQWKIQFHHKAPLGWLDWCRRLDESNCVKLG